jgi:hypothetical protein
MTPEVRQRAHQLEINARQHAPAAAVNQLAVYAAHLEAALTEERARLAELTGAKPVVIDVIEHGPVG